MEVMVQFRHPAFTFHSQIPSAAPSLPKCHRMKHQHGWVLFFFAKFAPHRFDEIVGGYLICVLGLVGLFGNALSVVVLGQKEMQQNNCFNKLLIGECGACMARHQLVDYE